MLVEAVRRTALCCRVEYSAQSTFEAENNALRKRTMISYIPAHIRRLELHCVAWYADMRRRITHHVARIMALHRGEPGPDVCHFRVFCWFVNWFLLFGLVLPSIPTAFHAHDRREL